MGVEYDNNKVNVSSIYTHLTAAQNQQRAYFRARIFAHAEVRRKWMEFEWICQTDLSGTAGNDIGSGNGKAMWNNDNAVGGAPAVTGFEVFASGGAGFGANSAIWARGIGPRLSGYT
jgi:hypothetical protein